MKVKPLKTCGVCGRGRGIVQRDWRSQHDQRKHCGSRLCESAGNKGCCGQIVSLVKDFGDGVVPTNHMFQQTAPGVIDEVI